MERLRESYKEVAARHGELKVQIRELSTYLENPRPDVTDTTARTWATDLTGRLVEFQNSLFHHFRGEERSGLMEEMGQRFPHAVPAITTLRTEHGRILQDLNSILSAAMTYSQGETPDNPHIRRWTSSLLDRLSHHEHEETELMQNLIYQDLGQGD
jgi:hemerythrin